MDSVKRFWLISRLMKRPDFNKLTPESFREIRMRLGFVSRKALALFLGVSWRTVENWEQGRSPIPEWMSLVFYLIEQVYKQKNI